MLQPTYRCDNVAGWLTSSPLTYMLASMLTITSTCIALLSPGVVRADIVWLKDGSIVYGRVLKSTGDDTEPGIVIRPAAVQSDDDRTSKSSDPLKIPREQISSMRINFDEARLSELAPANFRKYIEFAEELSAEKIDPVALRLAQRLYFYAAFSQDASIRRSALLGLRALEKDETRKRRIERYLLLRTGYGSKAATKPSKTESWSTQDGRLMLQLVKAIRRGQNQAAINLLRNGGEAETSEPESNSAHRDTFAKWGSSITLDELDRLARSNTLNEFELRKLLSIELQIEQMLRNVKPDPKQKPLGLTNKTWAEQASQAAPSSSVLPSIAELVGPTLSGIDVRANVYRNGGWKHPPRE